MVVVCRWRQPAVAATMVAPPLTFNKQKREIQGRNRCAKIREGVAYVTWLEWATQSSSVAGFDLQSPEKLHPTATSLSFSVSLLSFLLSLSLGSVCFHIRPWLAPANFLSLQHKIPATAVSSRRLLPLGLSFPSSTHEEGNAASWASLLATNETRSSELRIEVGTEGGRQDCGRH